MNQIKNLFRGISVKPALESLNEADPNLNVTQSVKLGDVLRAITKNDKDYLEKIMPDLFAEASDVLGIKPREELTEVSGGGWSFLPSLRPGMGFGSFVKQNTIFTAIVVTSTILATKGVIYVKNIRPIRRAWANATIPLVYPKAKTLYDQFSDGYFDGDEVDYHGPQTKDHFPGRGRLMLLKNSMLTSKNMNIDINILKLHTEKQYIDALAKELKYIPGKERMIRRWLFPVGRNYKHDIVGALIFFYIVFRHRFKLLVRSGLDSEKYIKEYNKVKSLFSSDEWNSIKKLINTNMFFQEISKLYAL